jgi:hypothetical protein
MMELANRAPPEQRSAFACVYASILIEQGQTETALDLITHLEPPQWMQARLERLHQILADHPKTPAQLTAILKHAPPLERLELLHSINGDSRKEQLEIERLETQLLEGLEDHPELRECFLARLGTLRERDMAHDALRRTP